MFYFLLLAAFVPFGGPITAFVESATNTVGLSVSAAATGEDTGAKNSTESTTQVDASATSFVPQDQRLAKEDYWNFWTYEKV